MNLLELILIRPIELLLEVLFEVFYSWTGSYGWSLVLMSLAVTLLTAPLYYLAEKWKKEEQVIRARMARDLESIRTHYSGQKRFYLLRNLRRLHGYRSIYALRTSLGLFIQIPFFFAAYRYLSGYEGYVSEGFLFIPDLGGPDGLLWGINALPLLMTGVNLLSSLIYTRSRSAKEMAQLLVLALLFLVLLYDRPAGLLVYWTMNNVFSLLKNLVFERSAEGKKGPGLAAVCLQIVRKYLARDRSPDALFVLMLLIVGGQSYWLHRFDESFKYGILVTTVVGSVFSLLFLVGYMRAGRPERRRSVLIAFFVVWGFFVAFAYILLYERRQNAYLSNLNIKLISVLIQDVLIYLTARWLVSRGAVDEVEVRGTTHGWLFVTGTVFFSAYLFLLYPMLIYFSSPVDVEMTLGTLVARNLPSATLLAFVAIGVYRLVGARGRRRALEVILTLIVATLVYNYLVPGDYGILDEFSLRKAYLMDETRAVLYLLDVIVIAGAYFLVKKALRSWSSIVAGVLAAVIVGFCVHTAVSAARMDRSAFVIAIPEENSDLPAESQETHRFSRNGKNVVFLIADMFNGNYMQRLLAEHPEYSALLDGFTWYSNTLSVSSTSATSLPALLGGWEYSPENMNTLPGTGRDKIANAVDTFYDAVLARDYDVVLVDPLYQNEETLWQDYGGKVKTTHASAYVGYWQSRRNQRPRGESRIRKNRLLVMATVFQSMPYMAKPRVYDAGSWIIFRKSYQFDYIARKTARSYGYLDLLPEISTADDAPGSVKVVYTQLTHEPFGVTREGRIVDQEFPDPETRSFTDGTSAYYAAKKLVDFVIAWTDWMKREGVYDNTYILITADHGNNSMDNGLALPRELNTPTHRYQTSSANILLVTKGFGASGPLRVEDRMMSNADTPALILSALGDTSTYGGDPASEPRVSDRVLKFTYLLDDWKDFLEDERARYGTYVVRGNIYDPQNWQKE